MALDYYNASHTPAAEPPPGVTSNFIDPPGQRDIILAYTTIFTIVATLGVAARMYTRIFIMKKVQLEDYLLTLSWGFFMVFNGFVYTQAIASVMGRHAWDVNLIQLQYFLWLLNITTVIYGPMLICAKGALILLWQRIFACSPNRRALWWFLRILLYVNIAVYICGMAIQTFTCTPREKIWQPWLEGTCLNTEASFLYTAAWNLFLDIILLVIPLFSSRGLNLQKKRKWILMGCFALGIITCVASILRIVNAVELAHSPDQIYDEQKSIWSAALEHTGVILVICAPAIPKLWRHIRGQPQEDAEAQPAHPRQSPDQGSRSRFCPKKSWIELGENTPSSMSFAGIPSNEKQWELDLEKELSYHEIKRSESVSEPMKVHIRSDVTISVAEARRTMSDPQIELPKTVCSRAKGTKEDIALFPSPPKK